MLQASIIKNDKRAWWLISIFSVVVFAAIALLGKLQLKINAGFDVHVFAKINAGVNIIVAVLLIAALWAVKNAKYQLHKQFMIASMMFSIVFLVSYIAHHLLAGEAKFGDADHNGILSDIEKQNAGSVRYLYYLLLSTHIILAAVILPFILFTAYRGLTGEWFAHKKLAKYTWPLWLYVAITGPIVYFFISPYYT